jgi:hypothetical protein
VDFDRVLEEAVRDVPVGPGVEDAWVEGSGVEVWEQGIELGLLVGAVEGGVGGEEVVERLGRLPRGEGVAAAGRVDDGVDQGRVAVERVA